MLTEFSHRWLPADLSQSPQAASDESSLHSELKTMRVNTKEVDQELKELLSGLILHMKGTHTDTADSLKKQQKNITKKFSSILRDSAALEGQIHTKIQQCALRILSKHK